MLSRGFYMSIFNKNECTSVVDFTRQAPLVYLIECTFSIQKLGNFEFRYSYYH